MTRGDRASRHRAWLSVAVLACGLLIGCQTTTHAPHVTTSRAETPPSPTSTCPSDPPADLSPIPIPPASPLAGLDVFSKPPIDVTLKIQVRTIDLGHVELGNTFRTITTFDGIPHRPIDIGVPPFNETLVSAGLLPPARALWANWFARRHDVAMAFRSSFEAAARARAEQNGDQRLKECARVSELSNQARARALTAEAEDIRDQLIVTLQSSMADSAASPETRFALAYALEQRRDPEEEVVLSRSIPVLNLYGSIVTGADSSKELVAATRMRLATMLMSSSDPSQAVDVLRAIVNEGKNDIVSATAAYDVATLSREPSTAADWFRRAHEIAAAVKEGRTIDVAATCELSIVYFSSGTPAELLDTAARCALLADTSELAGGIDPMSMAPYLAEAIEDGATAPKESKVPAAIFGPLGVLVAERDLALWDWDGAARALHAAILFAPESAEASRARLGFEALAHPDGAAPTAGQFVIPRRPKTYAELETNLRERLQALFVECDDAITGERPKEVRVTIDTSGQRVIIHADANNKSAHDSRSHDHVSCIERGSAYFESLEPLRIRAVVGRGR